MVHTERVGRPPRSVIGPESLAAGAASTFGAAAGAPAFQSCLAEAVCRPESFSGRVAPPASPRLRTSGTLALRFKRRIQLCDPLYGTAPRPPVEPPDLLALFLFPDRPQRRANQVCRRQRGRVGPPSPRPRRAAARRRPRSPARSPARAWARSCRWSRMPTRSRPPTYTSAPSRNGWRPSATKPRRRRVGPLARSSSSAARPMNSPLSQPTTQPSPAWSGVMPGPSSWPCSGRPASRRSVSRAPSPAGVDALRRGRPPRSAQRDLGRHGTLDAVLTRVAGARNQARRTAPFEAVDGEPADRRGLRRHPRQPCAGFGPLHGDDGPPCGHVRPADGLEHVGSCSRRWA